LGVVILANLTPMFLGAFCTPMVDRASGGARLGAYQIVVVIGPFLAYGMDALILTLFEVYRS
jgi:hypothetical protein